MPKTLKERLIEKGWPEEEAEKAYTILSGKKKELLPFRVIGGRIMYWMVLLVLFICNLMISVVLIPFLMVLPPLAIYPIVVVLGFAFGLWFNLLLTDIEQLSTRHHVIAFIFIPLISLFNLTVMSLVANRLSEIMQLAIEHNAVIIASAYIAAFILPHMVHVAREARKVR